MLVADWTRIGNEYVIEASILDWPAGVASIYFTTPCCKRMRNTAMLTLVTRDGDIVAWEGTCGCGAVLKVWND